MEGPNIPTLPIVEKDGNVASRDIFQPLDQVESSPHARVGTPSTSPLPPHSRLLVHTGSPLPSSPASPTSGKFYCSVCKKAFNNEATWSNHQNSAKHLNNVKEASRTSSGDMGKVIGRAAENSEATRSMNTAGVLPEVADARQKLKQAEKISSTNPAVAASVYWNVAKALHKTHHPQDTSRALQSLIRLIEEREQTLPPVGASGVTKEATSQLTPSQASMTLYLARLALARLNASYVVGVAVARVLYAKALEERWKVDVQEVDGVAQNLSALPLSTLTAMLESSLEGSDVLAKLSKPPKDPNLVAHLVLREAALVHARRLGEEDGAAHAAEGKALVWAGMAGVVCRLEGRKQESIQNLLFMSKMYESLTLPWYAADCLVAAARLSLEETLIPTGAETAKSALTSSSNQEVPRDMEGWWCIMGAMVLAVEIDDFVRAREIQQAVRQHRRVVHSRKTEPLKCESGFTDLDFLLRFSRAMRTRDHVYLQRSAINEAEHIALLLSFDMAESGWEPPLLLCAERFPDLVERRVAWERVVGVVRVKVEDA